MMVAYDVDNFSLDLITDAIKGFLNEPTMKRIFQYAVLVHKFNKTDNGQEYSDSEMIVEPTYILAKNEKDVVFKVTRLIPEEHASNPDNVEILVRPF